MIRLRLIGYILVSVFLQELYGQITNCGTELFPNQVNFESTFTDSINNLIKLNRTLNISIFIIEDEGGETGVNMADVNSMVALLNQAFLPVAVSFRIASTENIDNYHFNDVTKDENAKDLAIQYHHPKTINLYLAGHVYQTLNAEVCAFTYYPADNKDVIVLGKQCIAGAVLIEQIGHMLNLYHTHETAFGNERVDGTNCTTSGDLCCDTYADPNLSGKVDIGCSYSGTDKDANGDYYVPSTANYMANSLNDCKCFFSEEQYLRMINCLLKTKNYLW